MNIKFSLLALISFTIISTSIILSFDFHSHNRNNIILNISGSASMQEICEKLGDEFSKIYPNINIVKSGSGSTQAINTVKLGAAQIGDLSRPITKLENVDFFDIHVIARDAIALCTNKNNIINNISSDNLKDIFLKKISNWKYFGGKNRKIVLVGRDYASGTRQTFEKYLNISGKINYDVELENNGKIKYKIQNDEDAIGYISISSIDDSLNVLKIDGIYPSIENIKNSKYHITHPLLQITKKGANDAVLNAWFSFVFSKKGAAILKQNRFIPVPKN